MNFVHAHWREINLILVCLACTAWAVYCDQSTRINMPGQWGPHTALVIWSKLTLLTAVAMCIIIVCASKPDATYDTTSPNAIALLMAAVGFNVTDGVRFLWRERKFQEERERDNK